MHNYSVCFIFATTIKKIMQKLGVTEFSEVFFENLETIITTSLLHVEKEYPFYEEVAFKLFDLYQRDETNLSIKELLATFHIFLYSMFKHKPSVERNENEIKIL